MMRAAVEETHGSGVLPYSGGFAGLFALSASYADPILASTIDGVGTKVLVAKDLERYGSIGIDIVNHCANDVLATGARPLLFLDYVASGKLDPEDRKSTRLNSSHANISYAVFCLKKKKHRIQIYNNTVSVR